MRIAFVCNLLSRNGVPAIGAAISPFDNVRERVREMIGDGYVEVYTRCPVEKCIERDVKGMYKKALAGEIKGFTGIDDPFDEPTDSEVVCDTDKETPEESAAKIIQYLREHGFLPTAAQGDNGRGAQQPGVRAAD
jgi:adenylylsulfate kinase